MDKPDFSGFVTKENIKTIDARTGMIGQAQATAAINRLRTLYKKVTYKEGVTFEIAYSPEAIWVHCSMPVVDVVSKRTHRPSYFPAPNYFRGYLDDMDRYTPEHRDREFRIYSTLRIAWDQAQLYDDVVLLTMLYDHVQEMELHELREWFQVDGKPFQDPHPAFPVPPLDSMTERKN